MKDTPGGTYWRLDFKVAIAFGSTSLSARLTWKENVSVFVFVWFTKRKHADIL